MNQLHLEITIKGRVQGVGFRAGATHKARLLGLVGWAKNNNDGTVQIAIEGSKDQIQKFTEWCKEGTMLSMVDEVKIKPGPIENYHEFSIRKN